MKKERKNENISVRGLVLIDGLLGKGIEQELTDSDFNSLACRVFAYQFERNKFYKKYCLARNCTPENILRFEDIPAVPASAFKEVALACFSMDESINYFQTSGTTQGKQGRHYIRDYYLYHKSLLAAFSHYILPEKRPMEFIIISVPPDIQPHSSLIHMFEVVRKSLGLPQSAYYMNGNGFVFDRLVKRLREVQESITPVCLLGTSLAYRYFMDWCSESDKSFILPPGSRLMDTGGTKGKIAEIERSKQIQEYYNFFGIPEFAVINEYGMTEMFSQYYDCALRMHHLHKQVKHNAKMGPPWVRTIAVDPESLTPLPDGTAGLLRHFDLANVETVMAVQTEDIGVIHDKELVLLGRSSDTPQRGCSLTIKEIIQKE